LPGARYDYVVLDVFGGDTTPGHLLTVEALRDVEGRLEPGGILAANLIGSVGRESLMTASIVRTFEAAFETVELFPAFDPAMAEGFGNLIVVARQGPPLPFDPGRVAAFAVHPLARAGVARLGTRFRFPPETGAMVLSDEFNPVDARDAWVKERLRGAVLASTDWDVLI
jgi:hypothetical protein